MTDGSAKGFWMSAALHGAVAAAIFLFGYVLKSEERERATIFELVAGEGDNYMATEAPALGTPGGVKLDVPRQPEPKASPPPEPAPQESAPVTPAPPPPTPTPKITPAPLKPTEQPVPDFKQKLQTEVKKAQSKAKREIAKERAAEKKRLDEEQKRQAKEDAERASKAKSATPPAKDAPPKIPKIDYAGIAKGLSAGSTANTVGGAGGKALTALEGDEADRYGAALLQRLKEALDRTPGLDDALRAEAEFYISDEGRLTRAKITKSSRNDAFDRAVLDAIA